MMLLVLLFQQPGQRTGASAGGPIKTGRSQAISRRRRLTTQRSIPVKAVDRDPRKALRSIERGPCASIPPGCGCALKSSFGSYILVRCTQGLRSSKMLHTASSG